MNKTTINNPHYTISNSIKKSCKQVAEIFEKAILKELTLAEIQAELEPIQELAESKQPKGRYNFTMYERGYLKGYIKSHFDRLYAQYIETVIEFDGQLYSEHPNSFKIAISSLKDRIEDFIVNSCPRYMQWIDSDKRF